MRLTSLCLMTILFFTVTGATGETPTAESPALTQVWASENVLKVPESVLYDPAAEVLFVANINGNPTEKNGEGFISRLSLKGEIEKLRWATGLNAPKGMGISAGSLYVTDIDRVVAIDLTSATILKEYSVPEAQFLNDIAVAEDGAVYVSDMAPQTSAVYRIAGGKIEIWLQGDEILSPNGLYAEKDRLVIGNSGDGKLKAANFATRKITTLVEIGAGIDGVESDGAGGFFISDWQGATSWVSPAGEVTLLLDTTADKVNSADIELSPEHKLLFVPTFFDNRVVAYRVE